MEILKADSRATVRAPERHFTGNVYQDPIFDTPKPARVRSVRVTFAPGSRTHWHTHPFGQTLYITDGFGRVQRLGDAVHEVRAGDVVWFAPGEKHWHGAAPDHGMTHIAMQEHLDGVHVTWLEPVREEDYMAGS